MWVVAQPYYRCQETNYGSPLSRSLQHAFMSTGWKLARASETAHSTSRASMAGQEAEQLASSPPQCELGPEAAELARGGPEGREEAAFSLVERARLTAGQARGYLAWVTGNAFMPLEARLSGEFLYFVLHNLTVEGEIVCIVCFHCGLSHQPFASLLSYTTDKDVAVAERAERFAADFADIFSAEDVPDRQGGPAAEPGSQGEGSATWHSNIVMRGSSPVRLIGIGEQRPAPRRWCTALANHRRDLQWHSLQSRCDRVSDMLLREEPPNQASAPLVDLDALFSPSQPPQWWRQWHQLTARLAATAPGCRNSPFVPEPELGGQADFIDSGVVAVGELHLAIVWFRVSAHRQPTAA